MTLPGPHGDGLGTPAITVGIPCYNNATTLERAVDSVLAQTRPAVAILISDDASTDTSEAVGKALAARHPTVKYIRQPATLSPTHNFGFLVQQASTPYFMWLAGDDYVLPAYLERTGAVLDGDPGVVACVSRVMFTVNGEPKALATGTEPLAGDVLDNLAQYLDDPAANGRLYGLYRRAALLPAIPARHIHAWDWAAVAGTLLHGRHAEIPEVLMVRDETPSHKYVLAVRRDNPRWHDQLFPLAPMTRELLFRQRIPVNADIRRSLLRVNLDQHFLYVRQYYPEYSRVLGERLRRQLWRLTLPRSQRRTG